MPSGSNSLLFAIVNAFTNSVHGGNPAAVVFIHSLTAVADADLQVIAENFNQPIVTFISRLTSSQFPSPSDDLPETEIGVHVGRADGARTEAEFGIRWFTVNSEVSLCGHGSLAAAQAIFTHSPPLVSPSVTSVKFLSPAGQVVVVNKVEGGRLELTLENAAPLTALRGEEESKLTEAVKAAIGEEVKINFMGKSEKKTFKNYCLVDVDVENLEDLKVDVKSLISSPFGVNILTSASAVSGAKCSSRMFAPFFGVNEDPVCGSAHCLVGPYWAAKKGLQGAFMARMASKRGGDLRVTVDNEIYSDRIKLAGELRVIAKGELFL